MKETKHKHVKKRKLSEKVEKENRTRKLNEEVERI